MYIYKTTNSINGKIYIGLSTKEVDKSIDYYGSGTLIRNAISKYGKEKFTKEIIVDDIPTKEILCELEKYWILYYNSIDRTIGYNITSGGEWGDSLTNNPNILEIKIKMSNSAKNNWKDPEYRNHIMERIKQKWKDPIFFEKMSNTAKKTWTGRKHTQETIQKCKESKLGTNNPNYGKNLKDSTKNKLSDSLLGIKRSEETKIKMSISASNRIYNETICPYCNKIGKHNMNRYHFEKCKWKK